MVKLSDSTVHFFGLNLITMGWEELFSHDTQALLPKLVLYHFPHLFIRKVAHTRGFKNVVIGEVVSGISFMITERRFEVMEQRVWWMCRKPIFGGNPNFDELEANGGLGK